MDLYIDRPENITWWQPFNFSEPETWHTWIQRFDRFRSASGLEDKSGVTQVNSLIYSMGPEAAWHFRVIRAK